MPAADVIPNTFLPITLLKYKTFEFDNIAKYLRVFDGNKERPYFLLIRDEHFYSVYPVVTGLVALPFYIIPIALNKIPNLETPLYILKVLFLGRIIASFYAALAVLLMFNIFNYIVKRTKSLSKENLLNQKFWIYAFTLFFGLGTNVWSIYSRGLWQHTLSGVFIAFVIYLLIKDIDSPSQKNISWVGFLLGLSVLNRPTNLFFALAISGYVLFNRRQYIKGFILATIPSITFMLFYNHYIFGSALSEGYGARNDFNWSTPLSTSIPAYLFSPARSLLFISPPLVLSYYAIVKVFTNKKYLGEKNTLYRYLVLGLIPSIILFAKWYTWHGAPGFGNRMLSDYLPIFAVLAFEVVKNFKDLAKLIILSLIVYSCFIHANAVFNRKSRCSEDHTWNFYCLSPPKGPSQY